MAVVDISLSERIPASPQPDRERIPHHVAIIMDGNRRWAKKHQQPRHVGHRKGSEVLSKVLEESSNLGVKILTVYAFSTENWARSAGEVQELMHLVIAYLAKEKDHMVKKGVKFETIGDLTRLPMVLQNAIKIVKKATEDNDKITLVLALNYGARNELFRACKKIFDDIEIGKLAKTDFTEDTISKYLDTVGWPDPDLLIRTSGEKRVSNFLLWQLSYTEFYFVDTLWPDFKIDDYRDAIRDYQKRERRQGKT